jgi:hypothetical protein
MFKGITGADIDPATLKGKADLRLDVPINLKHVPDLAEMHRGFEECGQRIDGAGQPQAELGDDLIRLRIADQEGRVRDRQGPRVGEADLGGRVLDRRAAAGDRAGASIRPTSRST